MSLRRLLPLAAMALTVAIAADCANSIETAASRASSTPAVPEAIAPAAGAPAQRFVEVATTATPSPSVTVAFVGDLMLDRDVEDAMATVSVDYPLARTDELFAGADFVVGNLEGTLTDVGVPLQKRYAFATDPRLVDGLASFSAVSLANNHATDYGIVGLERTIAALDEAGIGWFGAGRTEEEARAPLLIVGGDGTTVAFLGYSDIGETIYARGDEGGVSRAGVEAIDRDVRVARDAADTDFVIVTLHAGTEYSPAPTERQRALARAAIDAGADLVVGHHPHVLQPIEEYEDGLILYSLGNFVFDLDAGDLATLGHGPFQSVVALVTFRVGEAPTLDLRPARIDVDENRPRPATTDEADAILALLEPAE